MKKRPDYETGHVSLLGDRLLNQDRCTLVESKESLLLALADGMGGHPKGEVAAEILIETCKTLFSRARKPIAEPFEFLEKLLYKAHETIIDYGDRQTPAIKPRTTAVIALVQQNQVFYVHCGDSRFYLIRDGKIHTRSLDHSYVELLHQQGLISAGARDKHPNRHYVTSCLGGTTAPHEISSGGPIELAPNDTLLLCSDGLWGALNDELLAKAVTAEQPFAETIDKLAHAASTTAFPESDNVTVVALRLWKGSPATPEKSVGEPVKSTGTASRGQDGDHELEQAIDDLKALIDNYETTHQQEKK